jgi:hypothetical protein
MDAMADSSSDSGSDSEGGGPHRPAWGGSPHLPFAPGYTAKWPPLEITTRLSPKRLALLARSPHCTDVQRALVYLMRQHSTSPTASKYTLDFEGRYTRPTPTPGFGVEWNVTKPQRLFILGGEHHSGTNLVQFDIKNSFPSSIAVALEGYRVDIKAHMPVFTSLVQDADAFRARVQDGLLPNAGELSGSEMEDDIEAFAKYLKPAEPNTGGSNDAKHHIMLVMFGVKPVPMAYSDDDVFALMTRLYKEFSAASSFLVEQAPVVEAAKAATARKLANDANKKLSRELAAAGAYKEVFAIDGAKRAKAGKPADGDTNADRLALLYANNDGCALADDMPDGVPASIMKRKKVKARALYFAAVMVEQSAVRAFISFMRERTTATLHGSYGDNLLYGFPTKPSSKAVLAMLKMGNRMVSKRLQSKRVVFCEESAALKPRALADMLGPLSFSDLNKAGRREEGIQVLMYGLGIRYPSLQFMRGSGGSLYAQVDPERPGFVQHVDDDLCKSVPALSFLHGASASPETIITRVVYMLTSNNIDDAGVKELRRWWDTTPEPLFPMVPNLQEDGLFCGFGTGDDTTLVIFEKGDEPRVVLNAKTPPRAAPRTTYFHHTPHAWEDELARVEAFIEHFESGKAAEDLEDNPISSMFTLFHDQFGDEGYGNLVVFAACVMNASCKSKLRMRGPHLVCSGSTSNGKSLAIECGFRQTQPAYQSRTLYMGKSGGSFLGLTPTRDLLMCLEAQGLIIQDGSSSAGLPGSTLKSFGGTAKEGTRSNTKYGGTDKTSIVMSAVFAGAANGPVTEANYVDPAVEKRLLVWPFDNPPSNGEDKTLGERHRCEEIGAWQLFCAKSYNQLYNWTKGSDDATSAVYKEHRALLEVVSAKYNLPQQHINALWTFVYTRSSALLKSLQTRINEVSPLATFIHDPVVDLYRFEKDDPTDLIKSFVPLTMFFKAFQDYLKEAHITFGKNLSLAELRSSLTEQSINPERVNTCRYCDCMRPVAAHWALGGGYKCSGMKVSRRTMYIIPGYSMFKNAARGADAAVAEWELMEAREYVPQQMDKRRKGKRKAAHSAVDAPPPAVRPHAAQAEEVEEFKEPSLTYFGWEVGLSQPELNDLYADVADSVDEAGNVIGEWAGTTLGKLLEAFKPSGADMRKLRAVAISRRVIRVGDSYAPKL